MCKLIAFLCLLSIGLFAEAEYDIILLAPEGQELTESETYYSHQCLNEAGYAWKSYSSGNIPPFIYHENLGFKIIPIPLDQYDKSKITAVNNQGIAVGILSKTINYWTPPYVRIFAYNSMSGEYYDLFDHFNSNGEEAYSIEGSAVLDLTISDTNEIIFKRSSDLRTYVYNLNNKTISIFTKGYFYAVNSKGQMIGGNNEEPEDSDDSWFFDLNVFHSLGSLDKFNRWTVQPEALSQNGFVVGRGLDSYGENKVFIWHPTFGLKETHSPQGYFTIKAINDSSQVIGSYLTAGKREYDHAFIICPELGFVDLGVLDGGKDSYANAINNQGQVVGEGRWDKAFIWDVQHGMRDLNTLIPQDALGWKGLSQAKAINDSGYIVGMGNYYGVEQYFLLIPKKHNN